MSKTTTKTTAQALLKAKAQATTSVPLNKTLTAKAGKRLLSEDEESILSDAKIPEGADVVVSGTAVADAPMVLAQATVAEGAVSGGSSSVTSAAISTGAAAGATGGLLTSSWVVGLAALGGMAVLVNNTMSDAVTTTPGGSDQIDSAAVSGVAIDGYLIGAKVYLVKPDGTKINAGPNNTEVLTDDQGRFTIQNPNGYTIQIEGGTNADTGLENTVVLKAPAASDGSIVVTPLTTMIQALVETNTGMSLAEAESAVKVALGIDADANISLTTYDPIAAGTSTDTAAAAIGVAVQKAAASVVAVIVQAQAAASGDADKVASIGTAVMQSLVAQVATVAADPVTVTPLSLTDASTVSALLTTAATKITDTALQSSLSSAITMVVSKVVETNTLISSASNLGSIANAQQTTIAPPTSTAWKLSGDVDLSAQNTTTLTNLLFGKTGGMDLNGKTLTLSLAQASSLANTVVTPNGGKLVIVDSLANLSADGAAAVLAAASSYSLSDLALTAADLSNETVANLAAAQIAAVAAVRDNAIVKGASNGGSITINNGSYSLLDTLANLSAEGAAAVRDAASSYVLSDTALTAASLSDQTVAGLAAAQAAAVTAVRDNAIVKGASNGASITVNNGSYTLLDTLTNLSADAAAAVRAAASSYIIADDAWNILEAGAGDAILSDASAIKLTGGEFSVFGAEELEALLEELSELDITITGGYSMEVNYADVTALAATLVNYPRVANVVLADVPKLTVEQAVELQALFDAEGSIITGRYVVKDTANAVIQAHESGFLSEKADYIDAIEINDYFLTASQVEPLMLLKSEFGSVITQTFLLFDSLANLVDVGRDILGSELVSGYELSDSDDTFEDLLVADALNSDQLAVLRGAINGDYFRYTFKDTLANLVDAKETVLYDTDRFYLLDDIEDFIDLPIAQALTEAALQVKGEAYNGSEYEYTLKDTWDNLRSAEITLLQGADRYSLEDITATFTANSITSSIDGLQIALEAAEASFFTDQEESDIYYGADNWRSYPIAVAYTLLDTAENLLAALANFDDRLGTAAGILLVDEVIELTLAQFVSLQRLEGFDVNVNQCTIVDTAFNLIEADPLALASAKTVKLSADAAVTPQQYEKLTQLNVDFNNYSVVTEYTLILDGDADFSAGSVPVGVIGIDLNGFAVTLNIAQASSLFDAITGMADGSAILIKDSASAVVALVMDQEGVPTADLERISKFIVTESVVNRAEASDLEYFATVLGDKLDAFKAYTLTDSASNLYNLDLSDYPNAKAITATSSELSLNDAKLLEALIVAGEGLVEGSYTLSGDADFVLTLASRLAHDYPNASALTLTGGEVSLYGAQLLEGLFAAQGSIVKGHYTLSGDAAEILQADEDGFFTDAVRQHITALVVDDTNLSVATVQALNTLKGSFADGVVTLNYTLNDTLSHLLAADDAILSGAANGEYTLSETEFEADAIDTTVAGLAKAISIAQSTYFTEAELAVIERSTNGGDVVVHVPYSITDTAANLLTAIDVGNLPAQASAYKLSENATALTVDQAKALFALSGFDVNGHRYTIVDSGLNIYNAIASDTSLLDGALAIELDSDAVLKPDQKTALEALTGFSSNGHTITTEFTYILTGATDFTTDEGAALLDGATGIELGEHNATLTLTQLNALRDITVGAGSLTIHAADGTPVLQTINQEWEETDLQLLADVDFKDVTFLTNAQLTFAYPDFYIDLNGNKGTFSSALLEQLDAQYGYGVVWNSSSDTGGLHLSLSADANISVYRNMGSVTSIDLNGHQAIVNADKFADVDEDPSNGLQPLSITDSSLTGAGTVYLAMDVATLSSSYWNDNAPSLPEGITGYVISDNPDNLAELTAEQMSGAYFVQFTQYGISLPVHVMETLLTLGDRFHANGYTAAIDGSATQVIGFFKEEVNLPSWAYMQKIAGDLSVAEISALESLQADGKFGNYSVRWSDLSVKDSLENLATYDIVNASNSFKTWILSSTTFTATPIESDLAGLTSAVNAAKEGFFSTQEAAIVAGASNKAEVTVSVPFAIADTAEHLLAANSAGLLPAGATAYKLSDNAASLTVAEAQTLLSLESFDANGHNYTIVDSALNIFNAISQNEALLAGASALQLSGNAVLTTAQKTAVEALSNFVANDYAIKTEFTYVMSANADFTGADAALFEGATGIDLQGHTAKVTLAQANNLQEIIVGTGTLNVMDGPTQLLKLYKYPGYNDVEIQLLADVDFVRVATFLGSAKIVIPEGYGYYMDFNGHTATLGHEVYPSLTLSYYDSIGGGGHIELVLTADADLSNKDLSYVTTIDVNGNNLVIDSEGLNGRTLTDSSSSQTNTVTLAATVNELNTSYGWMSYDESGVGTVTGELSLPDSVKSYSIFDSAAEIGKADAELLKGAQSVKLSYGGDISVAALETLLALGTGLDFNGKTLVLIDSGDKLNAYLKGPTQLPSIKTLTVDPYASSTTPVSLTLAQAQDLAASGVTIVGATIYPDGIPVMVGYEVSGSAVDVLAAFLDTAGMDAFLKSQYSAIRLTGDTPISLNDADALFPLATALMAGQSTVNVSDTVENYETYLATWGTLPYAGTHFVATGTDISVAQASTLLSNPSIKISGSVLMGGDPFNLTAEQAKTLTIADASLAGLTIMSADGSYPVLTISAGEGGKTLISILDSVDLASLAQGVLPASQLVGADVMINSQYTSAEIILSDTQYAAIASSLLEPNSGTPDTFILRLTSDQNLTDKDLSRFGALDINGQDVTLTLAQLQALKSGVSDSTSSETSNGLGAVTVKAGAAEFADYMLKLAQNEQTLSEHIKSVSFTDTGVVTLSVAQAQALSEKGFIGGVGDLTYRLADTVAKLGAAVPALFPEGQTFDVVLDPLTSISSQVGADVEFLNDSGFSGVVRLQGLTVFVEDPWAYPPVYPSLSSQITTLDLNGSQAHLNDAQLAALPNVIDSSQGHGGDIYLWKTSDAPSLRFTETLFGYLAALEDQSLGGAVPFSVTSDDGSTELFEFTINDGAYTFKILQDGVDLSSYGTVIGDYISRNNSPLGAVTVDLNGHDAKLSYGQYIGLIQDDGSTWTDANEDYINDTPNWSAGITNSVSGTTPSVTVVLAAGDDFNAPLPPSPFLVGFDVSAQIKHAGGLDADGAVDAIDGVSVSGEWNWNALTHELTWWDDVMYVDQGVYGAPLSVTLDNTVSSVTLDSDLHTFRIV